MLGGFLIRLELREMWFGDADPKKDQGGNQALHFMTERYYRAELEKHCCLNLSCVQKKQYWQI